MRHRPSLRGADTWSGVRHDPDDSDRGAESAGSTTALRPLLAALPVLRDAPGNPTRLPAWVLGRQAMGRMPRSPGLCFLRGSQGRVSAALVDMGLTAFSPLGPLPSSGTFSPCRVVCQESHGLTQPVHRKVRGAVSLRYSVLRGEGVLTSQ